MKSSNHSERKQTLIGCCVWISIKLMLWIIAGWLVAFIIGLSVFIFWKHQATFAYWQQLMKAQLHDLSYFHPIFTKQQPNLLATQSLQSFQNAVLIKTPIIEMIQQWQIRSVKIPYAILNLFVQKALPFVIALLKIIILVTELTIVRLVVLSLFLPVFAIAGMLGLIDGLIQRDLRRLGGGRESALLYHRARSCIVPLFFWGCFLYIVIPLPLRPDVILLPFAVLFGAAIFITASAFKKYL